MAGDPQVKPNILERQAAARAKRRDVEFSRKVKAEVRVLACDTCEVCHKNGIDHFHHKLMRSQGGKGTVDNCLAVCNLCHTKIHMNPYNSYVKGYLVRVS